MDTDRRGTQTDRRSAEREAGRSDRRVVLAPQVTTYVREFLPLTVTMNNGNVEHHFRRADRSDAERLVASLHRLGYVDTHIVPTATVRHG